MIYYHLSGNCMEENFETYLPWIEGCTEHFYVQFSKEQSIERLKLIFIDMYKAKHEDTEKGHIYLENITKSNYPMENINLKEEEKE